MKQNKLPPFCPPVGTFLDTRDTVLAPLGPRSFTQLADLLVETAKALNELGDWRYRNKTAEPEDLVHVDPRAFVDDDVYLGPGVRVHGTAVLKRGTVVERGAIIGNNCELGNTYVGIGATLGHLVSTSDAFIGRGAYLTANIIGAAVDLRNPDPRKPSINVGFRTPAGQRISLGRTKFGMVVGDEARLAAGLLLQPATFVGKNSHVFGPGVLPASVYGSNLTIRTQSNPQVSIETRVDSAAFELS